MPDLLKSTAGRRFLFAALYFSEGAPIGYVWWAMPTKLSVAGMPVEKVGLITALLVLPWALKFIWAPLIDSLRGPRWGFRAWIVTAQLLMGLTLAPLLWLPVADHLAVVTALLFMHAFFAATQDVAIDALSIASVPVPERGAVNGWMQTGMLAARGVFGGLALVVEEGITDFAAAIEVVTGGGWAVAPAQLGQGIVIAALIGSVWCTAALVLFVKEPAAAHARRTPGQRLAVFGLTLRKALTRRGTWLGLVLAAMGGAAYEAVGGLAGPILVAADAGQSQIGLFYAAPVIVCMVGGALAGGWVSDRFGRRRTVAGSLAMTALIVATIGVVHPGGVARDAEEQASRSSGEAAEPASESGDAVESGGADSGAPPGAGEPAAPAEPPGPPYLIFSLFALLYVFIGVFTASSYALFMDLTDPDIGGTQFSAFTGTTNLCESWSVFVASRAIAAWGVLGGLGLMALVSLAALPVVVALPSSRLREDRMGPPPTP